MDEDDRLETPVDQAVYADADFEFQSATVFGTTAARSAIPQQLAFACPSSECTFQPVSSLAVCSQCADLASHLKWDTLSGGDQFYDLAKEDGVAENRPNSTGYSLPNGLFLNN